MSSLTLVPTPIGNLGDITLRALEVMKHVDLILAEDTRKTHHLLTHFQIRKPVRAHHAHNEHSTLEKLIEQLKGGTSMALVTDAGTPGISDPGFLIVRACIAAGIKVETLPGPTAFLPALVNSGLPCDRFVFEGFLPQKKGRIRRLESIGAETRTMVFYESPHRVGKTLAQLAEHLGPERNAAVCRELTKVHEETVRGTLSELAAHYGTGAVKGGLVIVVAGKDSPGSSVG